MGTPNHIIVVYAVLVRVLAIDFGERRIGLALSDPTGTLARPWRVLAVKGTLEDAIDRLGREIDARLGDEEGLDQIVIGLPLRLDGSPSAQTRRVRTVARALAGRVAVPVALQDERLTSREADSRLALRERDWRKRKARLDTAAAAVILQDYLDQHVSRPAPPEPHAP